jgi:hypothetical protein
VNVNSTGVCHRVPSVISIGQCQNLLASKFIIDMDDDPLSNVPILKLPLSYNFLISKSL